MQTMARDNTDTHEKGPPMPPDQTKSVLVHYTPYPKLAIWSTSLSNASVSSFSGAMAGVASGIITCPLDVIKTKLQAQGSFSQAIAEGQRPRAIYHGLVGTARTIVEQDGLRGLYRGLGPMLLGYLPTWAVYMAVYDASRTYLYDNGWNDKERDRWLARIYSSVAAGACSTLATNPIWVIKTRLMSQVSMTATNGARTPWHYANTLDAARKMYRAEGLGAFYSGLAPALLGLTHVAIQFPLYEFFKGKFTGLELGETSTQKGDAGKNTAGILAATFLSKVCATSATYPHEVLRTRLQTQQRHAHVEDGHNGVGSAHHSQKLPKGRIGNTDGTAWQPRYRGVIQSCKIILREEGWRAFYSGMGTNMIRAVPAAMTTMLTFESIKGVIGRLQEEGNQLKLQDHG